MKLNLFGLTFVVFISVIISFYSCNKDENPVIPPEPPSPPPVQPDTANRYIWKKHIIYAQLTNLYVADTNEAYIIMNDALMKQKDSLTSAVIYNPNIIIKNVYGYDKNNIMAVGFRYKSGNYLPAVFKITNGNIQEFVYENERHISYDIFVTGPNQAWLSSFYESKVYYFDNGNLTTYRLHEHDTLKSGIFYKDPGNNLFVFTHKYPTVFVDTLYTYKFNGNSFELFRTDFLDPIHPDGKSNLITRCGPDVIMIPRSNKQIQRYFNGSEWVFHSKPFDTIMPIKVGGVSRDSLVILCAPDKIYTYGSGKWRKENSGPYFNPSGDLFTNVEAKYGNIYFASCNILSSQGYYLIGRPNKNIH